MSASDARQAPLGRAKGYLPRFADAELAVRLGATGAVLIEGARGCGKTETALQAARSAVRLDRDEQARAAGLVDPALLLEGARPRLIDEWQLVPRVWNQVRGDVDDHPDETGRFILAGSSVPADDETRHSGSLRFTRLRMRPMSLAESGHSTGDVSLTALFEGESPRAGDPGLVIRDLVERIAVGGWPALIGRSVNDALIALRGYLDETRRADLLRLDGVRRDPENVERVLRSLARHVATSASARSIAADIGGADGPIDYHTVLEYTNALTRLFVIEDQPAWSPALRSRSALRGAPTRHFVDPSLGVAALGTGPERLLRDVETLGLLFESLVVRDLRIYAQTMDANVLHYREDSGLEVDAIVERRDGTWAGFEVKLGQAGVDTAARSLLRVAQRVDAERHGPPAALAVITGWGYAYRRPDGVGVIPVGALAP
jgi:hypothetical protein